MLSGLVRVVPPSSIAAIVNVGDDTILHGLHISPDLDTITYTLAGMDNRETGWGVAGESWTVMEELERLGGESWFRLGDRDLATHLFRTERLRAGDSLTEVTSAIATRRQIDVRLLPVTDAPVRTMLTLAADTILGPDGTEVAFQDYFVRLRHGVPVRAVRFAGAEDARPSDLTSLERSARPSRSSCARPIPSSRSARSSPYRGSWPHSRRAAMS
jgi:LPPG:FO 2-phospho-L-lactate transferase